MEKNSQVNHYKIIEKIGEGGMGEVYLAHDSKLGRSVALKFLSEKLGQDDVYKRRFVREAQAAARLSHSNIVTVHEVAEFDNRPFIAMAFLKGETLDKYILNRKLSIKEIVQIGLQISEGLIAAHSLGITHRDLKLSNIIIDDNQNVFILDFGLALLNDNKGNSSDNTLTKLTEAGAIVGTVDYMAPEQLRGQPVDHLVDIFSLGIILHELSTGTRPFGGSTIAEISSSILRDQPKPVSEFRKDIPYDLQRLISRCLQKEPSRRIQTVRDIKNELEDLRTGNSGKMLAVEVLTGGSNKSQSVSELNFSLTADLVRKLECRSPKLIGAKMAYAVNNVRTESLMIILHNAATEHRNFMPVMDKIPCTCVAPTLVGWNWGARYRPVLSLADHSVILGEFFKHCKKEFTARKLILSGYASSASHILQMLTSPGGLDPKPDGLLFFLCNLDLASCFITGILAKLNSQNEANILAALNKISSERNSLEDWVRFQTYLVELIQRFGGDLEPLQRYCADMVKPFELDDLNTFPARYKAAVSQVPNVRFVYSKDEFPALDRLLDRHLEENVLGNKYREESIVRLDVPHVQVNRNEVLLEQALSFLNDMK